MTPAATIHRLFADPAATGARADEADHLAVDAACILAGLEAELTDAEHGIPIDPRDRDFDISCELAAALAAITGGGMTAHTRARGRVRIWLHRGRALAPSATEGRDA